MTNEGKLLLERLQAKDPTLTELILSEEILKENTNMGGKKTTADDASSQETLTNLFKLLPNNPHLVTVHLSRFAFNAVTLQLLLESLSKLPQLQHFTLQQTTVTASGSSSSSTSSSEPPQQQARRLGEALPWGQLQTLCLSDNTPQLGPRGCKVIAEFLSSSTSSNTSRGRKRKSNLTVLDLSKTAMGHFGAAAIGQALPCLQKSLQQLYMSHNGLGHDGVWKMAAGLSSLRQLRVLDISYNQCLDDGCLEVSRHLPQLQKLQHLSLAGNSVGSTGVECLAKELKQLRDSGSGGCLQRLDLSDNQIDNAGVLPLAQVLSSSFMPTLEYLDLSGNKLQDAGCTALAKGIVGADDSGAEEDSEEEEEEEEEALSEPKERAISSRLRVLKLARNQIGDGGAGTFVELLDDMPNMRVLDLSGNPDVSEARIRILTMLLKHRQATPLTPRTPLGETTRRAVPIAHEHDQGSSPSTATAAAVSSRTKLSLPLFPEPSDVYVGRRGRTSDGAVDEDSSHVGDLDAEAIKEGREELLELSFDADDATKGDSAVRVHLDYMLYLTDHFNSNQVLSHGTFGALYSAKDDGVDGEEQLAVRRLCLGPAGPLGSVRDDVLVELQDLRHKNLLPLLAMTTTTTGGGPSHSSKNDYCFLYNVTQLRPLRSLLKEKDLRKTLKWKLRIDILLGVARALVFLHGRDASSPKRHKPGFHGDIQPSNIFVGPSSSQWDLRVQLTDGGLGRLLATDRGRFLPGDVVFGSRSYRCPRYERGSCQYDSASDMFSYGIVLSEVLTGCLQGSLTSKSTGMANDFYYDNILLSDQNTTVKVDPLAGVLPRQAMEGLAQVGASCLTPVVMQRPSSDTVERILEQLELE